MLNGVKEDQTFDLGTIGICAMNWATWLKPK